MESCRVVLGNNSPTPKQVFGRSVAGSSPADDYFAFTIIRYQQSWFGVVVPMEYVRRDTGGAIGPDGDWYDA